MSSYTVLLDVWLDHARSMSDGSFLVDLWMEQARLIKTMDHELSLVSAMAFLVLVFFVSGKLTFSFISWLSGWKDAKTEWNRTQIVSCALLLFLACELPAWLSTPHEGLADLLQGTDPKLNEILERVPAIQRGPSPPILFRNRHVQFLPFMIQNEFHRLQGIPFQRLEVDVTDCLNKLVGCDYPVMNDTITLDVFPPFDETSEYSRNFNKSSPVILYAPGLRSNSQDLPGNSVVRRAYEAGFRSIVVNRRGHTPNQPLKSPRWNLYGDADDMEQVYWHLKDNWVTEKTPFLLYGVSSGTAVTVSAVEKWDKRRRLMESPDERIPSFVAFIVVSPGYDVSKVLTRERFLWPYNDLLMSGVKEHFVRQNEDLLREHDDHAVDRMLTASSLQDFVDASVRFAGYDNTTLFYQDLNPVNEFRDISTPTLVLNAKDDPCCVIGNLYENSPYPGHDNKTFAEMIQETERGMVAVAHTGSHCPFLCMRDRWLPLTRDPLVGGWMLNNWADEVTIDYFKAALDVYSERLNL